jgi:SAM-dependent methyltransferase
VAHQQQFDFVNSVRQKYPNNFLKAKVLEVGSLNLNGTVRDLFADCDYLGIDVGEGKDVDYVCQGQDLDDPENTYDTTISCECFEHNPYWKETFENMVRMTKVGGLVIFSCATTGRAEHGTKNSSPGDAPLITWDYYRNLTQEDFNVEGLFTEHQFSTNSGTHDLYFYGVKK